VSKKGILSPFIFETNSFLHHLFFRQREERELMMDRVPPPNAVAWGPNGALEDSPLDVAAQEAIQDIEISKRLLERKEEDVEDAKEEVVSLKK